MVQTVFGCRAAMLFAHDRVYSQRLRLLHVVLSTDVGGAFGTLHKTLYDLDRQLVRGASDTMPDVKSILPSMQMRPGAAQACLFMQLSRMVSLCDVAPRLMMMIMMMWGVHGVVRCGAQCGAPPRLVRERSSGCHVYVFVCACECLCACCCPTLIARAQEYCGRLTVNYRGVMEHWFHSLFDVRCQRDNFVGGADVFMTPQELLSVIDPLASIPNLAQLPTWMQTVSRLLASIGNVHSQRLLVSRVDEGTGREESCAVAVRVVDFGERGRPLVCNVVRHVLLMGCLGWTSVERESRKVVECCTRKRENENARNASNDEGA
jgi:hypothetical protein